MMSLLIWRIVVTVILNLLVVYCQKNESEFYIGGVVEYHSKILSSLSQNISTDVYIQENLNEYIKFIKTAKNHNVDILVFPEATFNYVTTRNDMIKFGFELPNPQENIAPWKYPETYSKNLRKISKEVYENQIYTLINLVEKERCGIDLGSEIVKCRREQANGFNVYNTNVVFDRQGRIISRYRKYNLFNEHMCDQPENADIAHFKTEFGVDFGHFICFDVMFREPALNLTRNKQITNILYPSYWFSDLPFLSSIQTHFGWAYANNVNFLSAGGNNPHTGTSGSGIIAGNKYIANTVITGTIEKHLLISELPKSIHNYEPDPAKTIFKTASIIKSPVELEKFGAVEHWSSFQVETWNITNDEIQRICIATDICCVFNIKTKMYDIPPGKIAYNYKLVANYTKRLFSHNRNCGEIYCSIIACTTENSDSCGKRFKNNNTNLINSADFKKIIITADIKAYPTETDLLIMPNSLNTSLTPIDTINYKFGKLKSFRESGFTYERYQIESKLSLNNLLTFGIYGRNFALDSSV